MTKIVKLKRSELIKLSNAHFNIIEPEDAQFLATFKIRLLKNKKILQAEVQDIAKIMEEKLVEVKKRRKEAMCKYWFKNAKGKYEEEESRCIFLNCVFWTEYKLLPGVTKIAYGDSFQKFLDLEENAIVIDELKAMIDEDVEVKLYVYFDTMCPDNIPKAFYEALDIITEIS